MRDPPAAVAHMSELGGAQAISPQTARAHYGERERGVDLQTGTGLVDEPEDISSMHITAADPILSNTPSSPRHVRFPPGYSDNASGSSSAIHSLTSASTLSTLESKLDLSPTDSAARKGLLRDSVFHEWKNDAADVEADSPEEMQKKDPLGTQIWKLYHKQKGQLPNSERLENLTWRMMSMNLRRKELERQGCVASGRGVCAHGLMCRCRLLARQRGQNAPSGIAQLRKSSEQASLDDQDRMNLDDFIVPSSIGTPAGVSPALSSNLADDSLTSTATAASAIPIKQQQRLQEAELQLSRASAPSVPALEDDRTGHEFGYVPRHVRKTSIDDRGVSFIPLVLIVTLPNLDRIENDPRRHRLKYPP